MKAYVTRWTFVLFFAFIAIFQGVVHAASAEIISLSVKDTYPGDVHDGFAQPGERIAISLEVVLDANPAEAYIVCDSEFGGVESANTRFVVRNGDTLISAMVEPVLFIEDDCPIDVTIPLNLIYRKDTIFDTLAFEIHTVGVLDSCFLDHKVNKPGKKVVIHALCSSSEGGTSGYSSIIAVVRKESAGTGDSIVLFDDGRHGDGTAADGHFSNSWWTLSNAHNYDIDVILNDSLMQHSHVMEQNTGFTTKWFTQANPYIIVADPYDNSSENDPAAGMKTMMDSLELACDEWSIWYRGFPDSSDLTQWGTRKTIIVWATKLGGTLKYSSSGKALLQYFLEKGGRLFIATPYLSSYISHYGERSDSLFLQQMLSAEFISLLSAEDSTRTLSLYDPFNEQLVDTFRVSLSLSDSNAFISFIDVLQPIPPAIPIVKEWSMDNEGPNALPCFGLRIEKENYRAIYLSFSMADIKSFSLRKDFFGSCLRWIATETADSFAHEPLVEEELEFVTLADPYPNPFLNASTIPFTLLYGGEVNLVICDLTGRTVKRLIQSTLHEGNYYAVWDGKDEKGEETAVGYYFVRLSIVTTDRRTGEEIFYVVSKKLLKLRK